MSTKNKDIELIERYLDNKLQPGELDKFNARLSDSEAFNLLYQEMNSLILGIQSSGRKKLLNDLDDIEMRISEGEGRKKEKMISLLLNKYVLFAAAASVLLAIFLPGLLSGDKNEALMAFNENFEPYPNIYNIKKRTVNSQNTEIDMAFNYYDNKQYKEAASLFEEIIKKKANSEISFYLAITHMAVGDTPKAIELLKEPNIKYAIQARWYLSLCYLKEENTEAAKKLLNEISKSKNSYSKKAEMILHNLN